MTAVRIVTDSACDLPKAQLDTHGIDVVPLTIRFGDEEFTDGVDLSTSEFWKRCRGAARLPETAAPSPGAFTASFERALADGCSGVVAIMLSSELSGTYQAAVVAAESMAPRLEVQVVDSRLVTAAQGLLCLEAAEFAATGAAASEVADHAKSRIASAGLVGTIDTMEHLVKGGRVAGAKALVGSLLSVKPILIVRDGSVVEDGRQRTRTRALEYLAARAEQLAPFDWVAVAGGAAKDLDVVIERLKGIDTTHPLLVTEIGPVVGTHAGPGVVGICWLRRG
jgi:DegV family protein with EDD domain